jgi:hypothetical protein
MLLRASAGDKTNASPLLGGSWGHFTLDLPAMVLPVGLSSWLILWMIHRRKEPSLGSAGMLFTVLLANAAVYIAITSRALSYQIFWLVPLVPMVVALNAMHRRDHNPGWSSMVYVLAATVLVAGLLRVGKITEVIASWTARDPQPIANFVCNQVPQNSRVFGPTGPYYYAVEECGSHYLYAGKWTASGLQSSLDPPDPVFRSGDFLLWPAGLPLPRTGEWQETARFSTHVDEAPGRSAFARLIRREFPFTGGYPQSILYKVK